MQKRSHKRDAIYEVLCSTKAHPSAEWIYSQVKQDIPDLSLATVYRNLKLFIDIGRAVSIAVVGGQARYDANTKPHPHFICTKCDAVIDIDCAGARVNTAEIEEDFGLKIQSQFLLLYGTCSECSV